jgi:hypothetical protein
VLLADAYHGTFVFETLHDLPHSRVARRIGKIPVNLPDGSLAPVPELAETLEFEAGKIG